MGKKYKDDDDDWFLPLLIGILIITIIVGGISEGNNLTNLYNEFENTSKATIIDKKITPAHYEEVAERIGRSTQYVNTLFPTTYTFVLKFGEEKEHLVRIYVLEKDYNLYEIGDEYTLDKNYDYNEEYLSN